MYKVTGLTKHMSSEGKTILDHISMEFGEGEMIGIVGPSGSGKSTLLRCLALRTRWNEGTYTSQGESLISESGRASMKNKSQFAYLEQNPQLNPNKTAHKNVLIGQAGQTPWWRRLTGAVRSDDYMGAMDELERFGLLDKAKVPAGKLSGGEKQRIAICMALVHGASVITADEPVVGLDPHSADRVLQTLKSICQEQGKTVIAALPIELAERWCTRIWGVAEGKLVLDVAGRRLTSSEKKLI
ncbi:phosphonate ABC transporter ATP-binding protein [Paenibacillus physcomitrellae]|uniref:Phosphonates import ATP-binding protein PhnC n=1 Tax=Paenibacillus physcomitrellae TaxID=1619311 RepID=A0ABQ1FPJ8_9BACL|nr:ATP-binding cassette domain-containing protein [Paenibacillus physcomitrellae]GGA25180.1 phosphonates import ATP-binding protein PhnC [Paenibacillus physcomitrellae]